MNRNSTPTQSYLQLDWLQLICRANNTSSIEVEFVSPAAKNDDEKSALFDLPTRKMGHTDSYSSCQRKQLVKMVALDDRKQAA